MLNALHDMTDKQKGILLIIVGAILFFHTVGIIETGLNYLIIVGSLMMILYGLVLINVHKKIAYYMQKRKNIQ